MIRYKIAFCLLVSAISDSDNKPYGVGTISVIPAKNWQKEKCGN